MDNGYTAVVYIQELSNTKKGMNRVLHTIYSPGTYLANDVYGGLTHQTISNHILCIWLEKYKPLTKSYGKERMVCGMSVVNIITGQSHIFEYETSFVMSPIHLMRWSVGLAYILQVKLFYGSMDDTAKHPS